MCPAKDIFHPGTKVAAATASVSSTSATRADFPAGTSVRHNVTDVDYMVAPDNRQFLREETLPPHRIKCDYTDKFGRRRSTILNVANIYRL
jgi:hypothetical protein